MKTEAHIGEDSKGWSAGPIGRCVNSFQAPEQS